MTIRIEPLSDTGLYVISVPREAKRNMTAGEVIAELSKFPPDTEVTAQADGIFQFVGRVDGTRIIAKNYEGL